MKHEARPYRIGDCLALDLAPAQRRDLSPENFQRLALAAPPGLAWSFFRRGAAAPFACGGFSPAARGVEAWSLLGANMAPADWRFLFRAARAALAAHPAARIEATAREGRASACKTLARLGFAFEGVMRRADWDGADLHLFARVKP